MLRAYFLPSPSFSVCRHSTALRAGSEMGDDTSFPTAPSPSFFFFFFLLVQTLLLRLFVATAPSILESVSPGAKASPTQVHVVFPSNPMYLLAN